MAQNGKPKQKRKKERFMKTLNSIMLILLGLYFISDSIYTIATSLFKSLSQEWLSRAEHPTDFWIKNILIFSIGASAILFLFILNKRTHYGEKPYQKEIEECKKAIKLKPDDADAYLELGETYLLANHHPEAIEAFKQAIQLKPDNSAACYLLGLAYSESKSYPEAIKAYNQLLKLDPNDEDAFCELALIYCNLSRYHDAIKAGQQAIKLTPDYAFAHYWLGFAYSKTGDKERAFEEYKVLQTLDRKLAKELKGDLRY